MLKGLALAAALSVAAPAMAQETQKPALRAEVVEVQGSSRPNPAGVILGDTLGGAVAGTAVGGGVALYNRYVSSDKNWGDWQRDLLIGAGVGAAVGLVLGVVDASSGPSTTATVTHAETEHPDVGFAATTAQYGMKF